MRVTFLGVRGTAPMPGDGASHFGGDTPCLEVAAGRKRIFLDAGTGLRHARMVKDREFDLILTHYHLDHLIGLMNFEPLWRSEARLRVWAPRLDGARPRETLANFFGPPYSPVRLEDAPANIEIRAFTPGEEWALAGGVKIATTLLHHPGGCAGVRIEENGARRLRSATSA